MTAEHMAGEIQETTSGQELFVLKARNRDGAAVPVVNATVGCKTAANFRKWDEIHLLVWWTPAWRGIGFIARVLWLGFNEVALGEQSEGTSAA